jgi:hypothetical protein
MSKYSAEVEAYLAAVPEKYLAPLRRVVDLVTEETGIQPVISYQIVCWPVKGKYGIYASGWKDHMSFHGGHFLAPLASEYPQWFKLKGATLWFQAEPELPLAAIRAVIDRRMSTLG